MIRALADEARATTQRLLLSLVIFVASAALALVAAAVAVTLGVVALARGLHDLVQLAISPPWAVHLVTGAILILIPGATLVAIAWRFRQPAIIPTPDRTHRSVGDSPTDA